LAAGEKIINNTIIFPKTLNTIPVAHRTWPPTFTAPLVSHQPQGLSAWQRAWRRACHTCDGAFHSTVVVVVIVMVRSLEISDLSFCFSSVCLATVHSRHPAVWIDRLLVTMDLPHATTTGNWSSSLSITTPARGGARHKPTDGCDANRSAATDHHHLVQGGDGQT